MYKNTTCNLSTDQIHLPYSISIVHYLCLIGQVYMFYIGHIDKSSLYETLFHCTVLIKKHHHHRTCKV
jgi:hypothetical protein